MSYSTIDDIRKLVPEDTLVQLTDDESTGAVVEARVNEAIASADGEIDSYCGTKYTVPFAVVPEVIKKCSVDIAIYNLYSRRVEEIPPTRSDRYKNAVRLLEAVAKGTVSLGIIPEPEATSGRDRIESTRTNENKVVTRAKLEGY